MIQEWFKELLIDGIISNLTGMFDTLNTKVGEIAGEVGMTPAAWNSSIFNMIRNLSETVIVPIAGIILTFVMCYELIQLIIEKNNLHDFDTWIFFKWIFKTFCAVLIVTNTWNIVMAVFDVAQNVVSQSAGVIISDAGIPGGWAHRGSTIFPPQYPTPSPAIWCSSWAPTTQPAYLM